LIGDECGHATFVVLNEALQHRDRAAVDMRAQPLVVGELAAGFDQKQVQVRMKHRVRIANALFDKAAKAEPYALREVRDAPVSEQVALERLELAGVSGRTGDSLDECRDEPIELIAQWMVLVGPHLF
jgi:hypothetical protein